MILISRDAESLYFCGTPTPGLEKLVFQTPTPALKNLDSSSDHEIRLQLQDLLCDIVIVYLRITSEKFNILLIKNAH